MPKRAQGMPLNVVVIAALVLIVLVSLLFIYGKQYTKFGKGLESCEAVGGACRDQGECDSRGGRSVSGGCGEPTDGQVCCSV